MMVPRSFMRPPHVPSDPSPSRKSSISSLYSQTSRRHHRSGASSPNPPLPRSSKPSSTKSSRSSSPQAPLLPFFSQTEKPRRPPTSQPRSMPTSVPTLASTQEHIHKENDPPRPSKLERTITAPVSLPSSEPMNIPSSRSSSASRSSRTRRNISKEAHDQSGLPPAVAALLATTAIRPRPLRSSKARTLPRRVSIEHLRQEWSKDVSASSSMVKGSPLDFLLESSTSSDDPLLLADDETEKAPSISATSRSVSSDSITSTPSLEADVEAYSSSFMSPSTPGTSLRRASRSERKICSPPAQPCDDHPLLKVIVPEDYPLDLKNNIAYVPRRPSAINKSKSSFKSNLTASFHALRSAAKAFSNFTAPSLPSDDFLTRSLLGSERFAPEMRPRSFSSTPDPALRRYLNPTPALSSSDFHVALSDALGGVEPDPGQASTSPPPPMIQLQTYTRSGRSKSIKKASAGSAPEKSVEHIIAGLPMQRQREPRENGDFLRVIVLEMNMRRAGKFDPKAAGRARIWLPPRRGDMGDERLIGEGPVRKEVPIRWIGQIP